MDTQLFSMGNSHCESEANIVELRETSHAIHSVNPYESVTVACSMFYFGLFTSLGM